MSRAEAQQEEAWASLGREAPLREPDLIGEVVTDDVTLPNVEPEPERAAGFAPYEYENRRQRRAAVANFTPHPGTPKAEATGLRRRLLEQRQRAALGKLDVKLRRLQKRKAKR